MDYKETRHLEAVVSCFGRLLQWQGHVRDKARVMVECMCDNIIAIPRSLVLKIGVEWGGEGRSWTVSVYILSDEFLDVHPGDEDLPLPNNGNPHPYEDPDADMKNQQHQDNNQDQHHGHNEGWPAWEPNDDDMA